MNASTISAVIMAAVVVMTAIAATIAWFYRRGKQEQTLAHSVERHADATDALAGQVGGLRDTLEKHSEILVDHHYRLKALESRTVEVRVK